MRFRLTGGERNDHTQAAALLDGFAPEAVIADKGYDSDALVAMIEARGAHAVIPSRSCRASRRATDWHLYKERHLIECLVGKLKHYRRVFSRFDKLARNYLSFVHLVSSLLWLK